MLFGELTINAVVFFGSLFLFVHTYQFQGLEVYGQLGPAYWPRFILACLMLLSMATAVVNVRSFKKTPAGNFPDLAPDNGTLRLMLAMGLIVGYMVLMRLAGFLAVTPFFMIAFMHLLGERSKFWMLIVSFGLTALIIILFTKAMYVPLPRGQWLFLKFSHLFY